MTDHAALVAEARDALVELRECLDDINTLTPADRAELLPCPFCGSPAELEHDNDHHGEWFNLGCSNHWGRVEPDKACLGARLFYTEDTEKEADAITAWNTRSVSVESAFEELLKESDQ